jgi:hypothetical protein
MALKHNFPREEEQQNRVEKEVRANTVSITHKHNTTFELHVGGIMYRFIGQETREVPRSVLTHPDFHDKIRDYFIVKE